MNAATVSWLLLFTFLAVTVQLSFEADWSYDHPGQHGHGSPDSTGTGAWKQHYVHCGGSRQSPIDIVPTSTSFAEGIGRFKFIGYDKLDPTYNYSLSNNGHTVQLNIKAGDIWIKGAALSDSYQLAQMHVHWGALNNVGSEHTVNHKAFPLEIHFVHFNNRKFANLSEAAAQQAGLAVIGVFGQVDRIAFPNEALQKLIDKFTAVRYMNVSTPIEPFELAGLLPENQQEFYRYTGSLTTPPCYESVVWTVMKNPLRISPIQLNAFRTLSHNPQAAPDVQLADNFRPVQPLGSRTVYRSFELPAVPAPKPVVGVKCAAYSWSHRAPINVLLLLVAMATTLNHLSSGGL